MDDINIDDYSRDRSRSPVSFSRRDYQAPKEGEVRERRDSHDIGGREDRGGRGGRRDRRDGRGDRRGGFRRDDRNERREESREEDRNYEKSIFVGNVPFESTSQDIAKMFGEFKIVRADIVMARGRSRGMATVEFESLQDVEDAIAKFDRTDFNGRELFVRKDRPPPADRRREEPRERRREEGSGNGANGGAGAEVFISNLPYSTTWQTLKDMMRTVGSVQRADVLSTKWGGSKGVGTVVFGTAEEALAAIEKFNGYNLEGRRLEVRHGRGTTERPKPARPTASNSAFTEGVLGDGQPCNVIYADNLPFITAQSDLFELFETIGRVNKAEIQYNQEGRPNGTAVVEFDAEELAELAIKNLDGYNYGGRRLRISYASRPAEAMEVTEAEIAEAPVEDVPVEDAPVEDAPVEDTPVEDAPVEEDAIVAE